MQMKWTAGDEEQIVELEQAPTFILVQMCNMALRKWDMRNPDAQHYIREILRAFRAKAEAPVAIEEIPKTTFEFSKQELWTLVEQLEGILKQIEDQLKELEAKELASGEEQTSVEEEPASGEEQSTIEEEQTPVVD